MTKNAVFFDLDGTLIDSAPGIAAGLQRAFEVCEIDHDFSDFSRLIGPPIHILLKRHFAHLDESLHQTIIKEFRNAYDEVSWKNYKEYGSTRTLFENLHQLQVDTYIATNKKFGVTAKILQELMPGFPDERILAPAHPFYPFSDKMEAVRNFLALKEDPWNHKIFVGDTEEDRTVATATGCTFVAAQYGYGTFDETLDFHKSSTFDSMSKTLLQLFTNAKTIQHGSYHESY